MANTKEQDLYVIKTTFNIEMYKLPQKCNRNILSLLQSTTTKRFNRGFDKLKSFELKSCKNRKKNPFLKEKHNKIKEKIHLEDRRIQMMKKRNRILDKNHLISNGKSYHISLGTQEIRNITIYESTPKAMYLPLIYDENSRNGISKTVKNEKDIIMCNSNKVESNYYFSSRDGFKIVRQDSEIRSIIRDVGNLELLCDKDDLKNSNEIDSISFPVINDWTTI